MNALEIKNLKKMYPDFTLDNLNLTLPTGCIMGLIGDAVIIGLNQGNPVESRVCTDLVLYF